MTDALTATFTALADPTRRAILLSLNEGPRTVNELVTANALSQPAISKHLKVLEAAHLISRTKVSRTRPCIIEPAPLREAAKWIDIYRARWESRLDAMDELISQFDPEPKK